MHWILSYSFLPDITSTGPCPTGKFLISHKLGTALPLLIVNHVNCNLSCRYIPYITSTGPCPTGTSPKSQELECPTVTSPISQDLVPILPVQPLYRKYWTLFYRFLSCITNTGPCRKGTPLFHKYWSLSYRYIPHIISTGPCHTVTSPISQVLDDVLPIHLPYPKNWTLSYRSILMS